MAELRLDRITLPTAPLGPVNPLPPLDNRGRDLHAIESDFDVHYGRPRSILPYLMQDGYSRDRRDVDCAVAVLENDQLRATFLLDYGGRLYSLVHKESSRELLHRNPMLQPANLALRNAWFAGGVEWNIGTTGHSPFTCAPVHAARVIRDDGTPVLRLYEWERLREVPFSIDCWLPDSSPVLLVQITIHNPHDDDVPMYWWSNTAVPETAGTRVIAPADSAYHFSYRSALQVVPIPIYAGRDVTYPARSAAAADYFFDTNGADRPWIAAVDEDGIGLLQVSSARLTGRKLFMWGRGPGGRRWQEFLSGPENNYCEIQAGLARTQLEHLPMPPRTTWSWMEAYGPLQIDPAAAHSTDWIRACAAVEAAISVPDLTPSDRQPDLTPEHLLHKGSGWGALEERRRKTLGEMPLDRPGTPFDDATLGPEQEPWLTLLETGRLPNQPPNSYVVGPTWRRLLDAAPDNSAAWLHRGVNAWHAGDIAEARSSWARAGDNPYALRNSAIIAEPVDPDLLLRAHSLAPDLQPLTIETVRALITADRPTDALMLLSDTSGRLRLLEIEASIAAGDLDRAAAAFETPFTVPDLREGERSIGELWFAYHEARAARILDRPLDDREREQVRHDNPLPRHYDFRMHE